jgi:DNA-binding transcriptional MerR regulator
MIDTVTVDREEFPFKMKDLCDRTGLDRQVIHFYIQQGLLPEGQKTGRNMAYYNDSHVERILLIRQLQHERFLPLKAIKAVLEQRDDAFSPGQRRILAEMKKHIPLPDNQEPAFAETHEPAVHAHTSLDGRKLLPVAEVLERTGADPQDPLDMVEIGVIATVEGPNGEMLIPEEYYWRLDLFGQLRRAGFTRELGFKPQDFQMLDELISELFKQEVSLMTRRLGHLPPQEIATLIKRSLPILNAALARVHDFKVRGFFAAL